MAETEDFNIERIRSFNIEDARRIAGREENGFYIKIKERLIEHIMSNYDENFIFKREVHVLSITDGEVPLKKNLKEMFKSDGFFSKISYRNTNGEKEYSLYENGWIKIRVEIVNTWRDPEDSS